MSGGFYGLMGLFGVFGPGAFKPIINKTPSNTIIDFKLELSGLVTEDDGSKKLFIVAWDDQAIDLFPEETAKSWEAIISSDEGKKFLVKVLETIVGENNVIVSSS